MSAIKKKDVTIEKLSNMVQDAEDANVNQRDHLLEKCRVLWDELQRRDVKEDDENLVGISGHDLAVVEEEERR